MSKITEEMTNNEIAYAVKVKSQTPFIRGLYEKYAEDLTRARVYQTGFYRQVVCPMFDDVEAEWLYLLVRHLGEKGPVTAVEVGPGCGWSTSWILRALEHNGEGHLVSVDPHDAAEHNIPAELARGRWSFIHGLIEDHYHEGIDPFFDFLLIDSNHNEPFVSELMGEMLPRVRPGGFACVHDIYMLQYPASGEAIAVYRYLDQVNAQPFTPSKTYTKSFQAIRRTRKDLGLGVPIHPFDTNPLLVFEVP